MKNEKSILIYHQILNTYQFSTPSYISLNENLIQFSNEWVKTILKKVFFSLILGASGQFLKICSWINFERNIFFEEHLVGCCSLYIKLYPLYKMYEYNQFHPTCFPTLAVHLTDPRADEGRISIKIYVFTYINY